MIYVNDAGAPRGDNDRRKHLCFRPTPNYGSSTPVEEPDFFPPQRDASEAVRSGMRHPPDVPPAPSDHGSSHHHCRSILVASRDQVTCGRLAAELGGLGCFVVGPFTTNEAALGWLDGTNLADMALLDVELADGSSLALARKLQGEGMPLVFFAGFDPRRRTLRAEEQGRPG